MSSNPVSASAAPAPLGLARRSLRTALRVIAALLLALLMTEGALRLVGFRIPPRMPAEKTGVLQPVPESEVPGLGLMLRAGASGETSYPGRTPEEARRVVYSINELGFRGPSTPRLKPDGRLRVALLGDSVTYGTGINAEETLAAQLERLLREALGRDVEVLNCGVPATNTGQQVALLRHRVIGTQPDLVLICSTIVDTSGYGIRHPQRERPDEARWIEAFGLTSGVYESELLTPAQQRTMTWRRRSRLVDLVANKLYRALYARVSVENYKACWAADGPGVESLRAALALAGEIAAKRDFTLRVAMYPSLVDLGDDYPFADETARLAALCAELEIPFTDLLEPLRGHDPGALRAHAHDRHPNGRANALVARFLADVLAPELAQQP